MAARAADGGNKYGYLPPYINKNHSACTHNARVHTIYRLSHFTLYRNWYLVVLRSWYHGSSFWDRVGSMLHVGTTHRNTRTNYLQLAMDKTKTSCIIYIHW